MSRTFQVTRKHIREGKPNMLKACPIALSLKEAIGCETPVIAGAEVVRIGGDFYDLPRSVQRFIKRFDAGKPVKPFRFRLDLL